MAHAGRRTLRRHWHKHPSLLVGEEVCVLEEAAQALLIAGYPASILIVPPRDAWS